MSTPRSLRVLLNVADPDPVRTLVLRGVPVDGPSDKPWGHRSASVRDPAGMEVVLYAEKDR